MTTIRSIHTAVPKYKTDNASILKAAAIWLKESPEQFELFHRYLTSSRTLCRYFVLPPLELLSLPGSEGRAQIFEREARALAARALGGALQSANLSGGELDALIFTSCSCPLIPAPDTYLIDQFELRRDILRIPSYQYGCAGGVIGLGLARHLAGKRNIAVVSVELCSLVFQPANRSASHLVGSAIFGDGSAAVILTTDDLPGLKLIAQQSYLLPESRHLMGYDIRDDGMHLRLDKDLPAFLIDAVRDRVASFLAAENLAKDDIAWWLFHPGGSKILTFLDEVLELRSDQSKFATEVLRSVGNLSSASIIFVMKQFLESKVYRQGDKIIILGVGPGLTLELILAEAPA